MSNPLNHRGQALVELALVLPIFLLILFGIVDGARLGYANNQLSQAAREGARVAAVEASQVGATGPACVASESQITSSTPGAYVCPADVPQPGPWPLKADVVSAVNRMTVGLGQIPASDVYLACDVGDNSDPAPTGAWTTAPWPDCRGSGVPNGAGDVVSVRVVYQFNPITPIAGSIIGTVALSGSASMVINGFASH